MIRFLADENFNGKILRSLRRDYPEVDVVRVQDTAIYGATDPQVLEWAAQEGRILLTHDVELKRWSVLPTHGSPRGCRCRA